MCFSARLVCLMGGATAFGCHGGSLVAGVPVVGGVWFTRLKVDDTIFPLRWRKRGADEVGGEGYRGIDVVWVLLFLCSRVSSSKSRGFTRTTGATGHP